MSEIIGANGQEKNPENLIVVLTMNPRTFKLEIGGNFLENLDVLMNMLSQALRWADVQYRVAAGIAAQQQLRQQQNDLEVAKLLFSRKA
jgi:hypothetical protein